jgi:hypothetical protein
MPWCFRPVSQSSYFGLRQILGALDPGGKIMRRYNRLECNRTQNRFSAGADHAPEMLDRRRN